MSLSVTVLVPAHNEAATIQQVVRSCRHQTYLAEKVVVIDDGSTDDTARLARDAGAQVVTSTGGSKARALNVGLGEVTSDLVVAVDADTFLAPDAINELVATIEEGYDGTCAAVLPQQGRGLFVRARRFEYVLARRWLKRVESTLGRVHVLSGAAFCFRTSALRAIGGVPLDVPIAEDMDLTWTLQGAGYRIGYSPRAVAYTREPETLGEYVGQTQRWAAGGAQTIARHRRQLSNPRRLFVVSCRLWDLATVSLPWLLLTWLMVVHGSNGLGMFGLLAVAFSLLVFAVAARDLGPAEAAKCFLAHAAVAPLSRWLYRWGLIREWVLGRHYASWTGRQGRKTVITGMSGRRKLSLGTASMVMVAGFVALGRPPAGPSSPVPPVLAAEPFPEAFPLDVEPALPRVLPPVESPPILALRRGDPSPTAGGRMVVAAGFVPAPITAAEGRTGSRSSLPPAGEPTRPPAVAPNREPMPKTEPAPAPDTTVEPEPAPEPSPEPKPPAERGSRPDSAPPRAPEPPDGPEPGAGATESV